VLQRDDLRVDGGELDLSRFRDLRAVRQLVAYLRQLVLLVGQFRLGLAQRLGLCREFFFGGAQLFLHGLFACLELEDRCVLLAELEFHPVDRFGFLAQFSKLARGLGLELVDAYLQPPRRHCEFGAQLVLVGLDLGHRQRRRCLQPPGGQADGAAVHQGNDGEPEQGGDQKTDREIHDRLDHGALRLLRTSLPCHGAPAERQPHPALT
jgi:hypothetical protein